jgi:hypothetical protein
MAVLRLERTTEFVRGGSGDMNTKGVLEDATCVAGFGGLTLVILQNL